MTGIYIHIPFCDKACHYCGFHFSTTFAPYRKRLIDCLILELKKRTSHLSEISTIYFGGGTPSVLTLSEFKLFFDYFNSKDWLKNIQEVTVEVNPDHVNETYLSGLKELGVTRLSMGIQSFHDPVLNKLNRHHNRATSINALNILAETGFDNYTIDLIYGIPFQTEQQLQENLEIIAEFNIPHISAYQLTIEENTVFGKWLEKGKLAELDDEEALKQFKIVRSFLIKNGYDHYEVSNFSKPGFAAKHNASYWKRIPYIGIGPSAHSYDLNTRTWNVANNQKYIQGVESESFDFESEQLSDLDQFNEAIILGLRQINHGIDIHEMEKHFPEFWKQCEVKVKEIQKDNLLILNNDRLKLSPEGIFVIDWVTRELML